MADINVEHPVEYTITQNLNNTKSNNSNSIVYENQSYGAVIKAKNGNAITSVTVTMGGVDITNVVFNGKE